VSLMSADASAWVRWPRSGRTGAVIALLVAAVICLMGGAAWATSGTSGPSDSTDVGICHATNAEDNPYRLIVVASAARANAHIDHTGPIFVPGMKDQGIRWGDIIEPFTFGGEDFPGLNWPAGADILGAGCVVPEPEPPPDVCPNIPGDQSEPPPGTVIDENGDCVEEVPPTDVCPNIPGDQSEPPAGTVIDENGDCVEEVPPTDVCPNIPGDQSEPPAGTVIDENGDCVEEGSGGSTPSPAAPGGGGGPDGGTAPGSSTGGGPGSGAGADTRVEAGAPLASGGGSAGAAPDGPAAAAPDGPAAAAPRSQAVPPSAVDAGLAPTSTVSDKAVLAQVLVGLGVALMTGAGLVGLGGRRRGAYRA
jgi:hypothetical protein